MTEEKLNFEDHSIPREDEWVEITIAPADHEQYWDAPVYTETQLSFKDDRTDLFVKHFSKFFFDLNTYSKDFIFFLEMSITGRLHYHGLVKIKKPLQTIHYINKFKYSFTKNRINDERRIAIYRIQDDVKLKERFKYISKDRDVVKIYHTHNFSKIDIDKFLE